MPRKRRHYRTSSKSRTSSNDLFEIIFKLVLYLTIGVFILCFQGISWLIKTMSAHKKDKMVVSNIKTSKQDKLNVNVKSTYTTLKDCKICIGALMQYYDFVLNCPYMLEYIQYYTEEELDKLIDEMSVFSAKLDEFKTARDLCIYNILHLRINSKFANALLFKKRSNKIKYDFLMQFDISNTNKVLDILDYYNETLEFMRKANEWNTCFIKVKEEQEIEDLLKCSEYLISLAKELNLSCIALDKRLDFTNDFYISLLDLKCIDIDYLYNLLRQDFEVSSIEVTQSCIFYRLVDDLIQRVYDISKCIDILLNFDFDVVEFDSVKNYSVSLLHLCTIQNIRKQTFLSLFDCNDLENLKEHAVFIFENASKLDLIKLKLYLSTNYVRKYEIVYQSIAYLYYTKGYKELNKKLNVLKSMNLTNACEFYPNVYNQCKHLNVLKTQLLPFFSKNADDIMFYFSKINKDKMLPKYEYLLNRNYVENAESVIRICYFDSSEYKDLKERVNNSVIEANELNEYVAQLSKGIHFAKDKTVNAGIDLVKYEHTKFGNTHMELFSNIHNEYMCSNIVLAGARNNPLKYVCKYFNLPINQDTLYACEEFIQIYESVKIGKESYKIKIKKLGEDIIKSVPSGIGLTVEIVQQALGLQEIEIETPVFPSCSFIYKSPKGNSEDKLEIQFTEETMNNLIEYVGSTLNARSNAKYQRALMTSALRHEILERDNYTCVFCGNSVYNEPNLLLEIDHIIPVSKGGLTIRNNLQTLCWKCNRSKSNKISNE